MNRNQYVLHPGLIIVHGPGYCKEYKPARHD